MAALVGTRPEGDDVGSFVGRVVQGRKGDLVPIGRRILGSSLGGELKD